MIGGVTMWEIIWTGELSHLPGVSHPHVNEPLKNQKNSYLVLRHRLGETKQNKWIITPVLDW